MRATGCVGISMALLVLGGCSLIVEGEGPFQDTQSHSDQDTTSNSTDTGLGTDDTGPGTDDTGVQTSSHTGDTGDTGVSTGDTGDPDLPVEVEEVVLNNGAEFTTNVLVEVFSKARNATQMRLRNDEGPWSQWYPFMAKRTWTLSPEQGKRKVTVEFRNDISGPKDAFDLIILDTIPPNRPMVSCITCENEYHINKQMVLFRWESGGGGMGDFRWKLNDENLEMDAIYTKELTGETEPLFDGHYTVYVQERDQAGNWSQSGSTSFYMDLSGPWIAEFSVVEPNSGRTCTYSYGTKVDLRIVLDDGDGIGVKDMRLRNEFSSWLPWMEPKQDIAGWELPAGHDWAAIEIEARDRFDQVSQSMTGVFRDDFYEQCVGNDSFESAWRVEGELTSAFSGPLLPVGDHGLPLMGQMSDFYAIKVPEGSGGIIRVARNSGNTLGIGVNIYAEDGTFIELGEGKVWLKEIFIDGRGAVPGRVCPHCYCTDKVDLYYLEVFGDFMEGTVEPYDLSFTGDPNACNIL